MGQLKLKCVLPGANYDERFRPPHLLARDVGRETQDKAVGFVRGIFGRIDR